MISWLLLSLPPNRAIFLPSLLCAWKLPSQFFLGVGQRKEPTQDGGRGEKKIKAFIPPPSLVPGLSLHTPSYCPRVSSKLPVSLISGNASPFPSSFRPSWKELWLLLISESLIIPYCFLIPLTPSVHCSLIRISFYEPLRMSSVSHQGTELIFFPNWFFK